MGLPTSALPFDLREAAGGDAPGAGLSGSHATACGSSPGPQTVPCPACVGGRRLGRAGGTAGPVGGGGGTGFGLAETC
jgi:hypothetical protein